MKKYIGIMVLTALLSLTGCGIEVEKIDNTAEQTTEAPAMQRIVAVHALGVHLVRVEARAHAGGSIVAHGLADGLTAHGVLVVDDIEQNRQAALHVAFPQVGQLTHAGHIQGLQDRGPAVAAPLRTLRTALRHLPATRH